MGLLSFVFFLRSCNAKPIWDDLSQTRNVLPKKTAGEWCHWSEGKSPVPVLGILHSEFKTESITSLLFSCLPITVPAFLPLILSYHVFKQYKWLFAIDFWIIYLYIIFYLKHVNFCSCVVVLLRNKTVIKFI